MGTSKPTKPYPSFPLTPHPNGQWCKKICGKLHFLGVWADRDGALQRYLAEAADLHAGREPRASMLSGNGLTVKEIGNEFLNWQKEKLDAGEIGLRWFEDCRKIVVDFAKAVGKERLVSDLRSEDFRKYRMNLAKRLGVHALTRYVVTLRSIFKYAYEADLVDNAVKFGTGFATPTAVQKRKVKSEKMQENGKRLFTREELLRLLDACDREMRTAILLGINGGFGNTDCARLPVSAIDFDTAVIEFDRPRTGVQRVVPLWKQTVDALRDVLNERRPNPENKATAKLVFLTPTGRPIVRQLMSTDQEGRVVKVSNTDELSKRFTHLLKSLGIYRPGIGFYTLRHTFRTWADETRDQHAIYHIMGHAIPGMSGIYVEEVEVSRLRAVVEHVRRKLFFTQ